MGDPDPAAEVEALRAALEAEHRRSEAAAGLITEVDGLAGRLLATDLTPEQREWVARVRRLCEALAKLAGGAPGAAPEAAAAVDRPRVLLVEDDAVNRRIVEVMLERRGYAVDAAADGREAVEATGRTAYAAVLMDCHMPRLDGYAATREIRARDTTVRRVPIVAMTANSVEGERERCLAAGMDDYVSKPLTIDVLDAALRRWVPEAPARAEAPARRRPSSPPVDLGMLRKLQGGQGQGQPDIVAEVVALFLRDAPARLAEIRDAVGRGDLSAAARAAHTLKGSAGHLGAKTLTLLAARFDEKARAGAPFDVAFAVGAIAEELDRVRSALSREGGV